jgi:hypothetical protein
MMAKLILSLENKFLNQYPLDKALTTIGRRTTNDIHIDNLAVSGEHAAISKIGKDYYIEDLASTNGTLVNAQRIKKHFLQHADIIELGKYQIKYINEATSSNLGVDADGSGFEKTMMVLPSAIRMTEQTQVPSVISAPAIAPTSTPDMAAATLSVSPETDTVGFAIGRIQVLNGSSVGRELALNKALTTLGKTGVQVAVITKRSNGYFITHVEGVLFPTVNGTSTGAQAVALKDHDVIELAGVKMEFYLDYV